MIGGNESGKNEGRRTPLEEIENVRGEARTSDRIFVDAHRNVGTKEVEAGVGAGNGEKRNRYCVVRLCCDLDSCILFLVLSPSPSPGPVRGHTPNSFRLMNMDG